MEPTAEIFEKALLDLKQLILNQGDCTREQILFFNAWNEWSEGSYLEPDTKRGYAFLEAVKKISAK